MNVKKQTTPTNRLESIGKLSVPDGLISECTDGNTDNVIKNTKNTLKSCGELCLKIFQYGGRASTFIPAARFFSFSFSFKIS